MTDRYIEVEVPGLRWSAGAPDPFVVSSEHRTLFAFIPSEDEVTESPGSQETYRVAEFVGCVSVRFGFPNDEAAGPLMERGLAIYSVNEVPASAWLEQMRGVERQHPRALPTPFASARHWVLSFHDSTLEALADDIV